ncbi:MAG: orotidine-5'-phosphate decarboxylase [Myxococcales bacterium]
MTARERLIAALDVPDAAAARALAGRLAGAVGLFKIGLELFCGEGPSIVRELSALAPVFLDLKLHDIPATVEGAARQAGRLGVAMLTVHASGGAEALEAAARGAAAGAREAGRSPPLLLAVTVLTSLDETGLAEIGLSGSTAEAALRLARLALRSGAEGLVCSPREASAFRRDLGSTPVLVTPGIRAAGAPQGDQARIASAAEAVAAGADYVVVGRPIRDAPDPRAAAEALAREIDRTT